MLVSKQHSNIFVANFPNLPGDSSPPEIPQSDLFLAPDVITFDLLLYPEEPQVKRSRSSLLPLNEERFKYIRDTKDFIAEYVRNGMCLDFRPDRMGEEGRAGITVVRRIGGESVHGAVYETNVSAGNNTTFKVATKMSPFLTPESEDEIENEIKIGMRASEDVEMGKTKAFPVFYGYIECKDTRFDESSVLYRRAFGYALYFNMVTLVAKYTDPTRFAQLVYNKTTEYEKAFFINPFKILRLWKDSASEEVKPYVDHAPPIRSYLMVMELVSGDVRSFFLKGFSTFKLSDYMDMIIQILDGIKYMHQNLKVVHRDSHVGNILIRYERNTGKREYLITDFGKAIIKPPGEQVTLDEAYGDMELFLGTLRIVTREALDDRSYAIVDGYLEYIIAVTFNYDGEGTMLADTVMKKAMSVVEKKEFSDATLMTVNATGTSSIKLIPTTVPMKNTTTTTTKRKDNPLAYTKKKQPNTPSITKGMRKLIL